MKIRIIAAFLALVALAACGGANNSDDKVASGEAVTVRMFDASFEFTEIHVPVGGSVTFVGTSDVLPHNAVAADGSWSTETVFGSLEQYDGDQAELTFDTAGTYVFYCTFHGNAQGGGMAGTLVVGS